MFHPDCPGLPSPQEPRRFLSLLEDVRRIQQALLEERARLWARVRARVRELEAEREGGRS